MEKRDKFWQTAALLEPFFAHCGITSLFSDLMKLDNAVGSRERKMLLNLLAY